LLEVKNSRRFFIFFEKFPSVTDGMVDAEGNWRIELEFPVATLRDEGAPAYDRLRLYMVRRNMAKDTSK
jgi:hypothetical protein